MNKNMVLLGCIFKLLYPEMHAHHTIRRNALVTALLQANLYSNAVPTTCQRDVRFFVCSCRP